MEWWKQPQIEIPIFPLPSVVQFPGTLLPLHIFEPRYREMIKDAIEGDGRIALALLKPGYEADYYGAPEVYPVACAGRVIAHDALPDGRYHILVAGLVRIRLLEQLKTTPYRVFRAETLPIPPIVEDDALRANLQTLLACTQQLSRVSADVAKAFKELNALHSQPSLLVDVAASIFLNEPEQKQQILEMTDLHLRLKQVTEALGGLILQTKKGKQGGTLN